MRGLRILNLEDDPLDTELIQADLAEGGVPCEMIRVYSRDDFLAELEGGEFDLVLSDYSLPGFDGLSALEIAREIRPEVPFIFVSGAIGEERAIESLKSGATDYVLKDRLERLVPAVRRAMREVEERIERRRTEEALRQSEERYRAVIEQSAEGIYLLECRTMRVLETNPALQRLLGHTADELRGMEVYGLISLKKEEVDAALRRTLEEGRRFVGERLYRRSDGSSVAVEVGESVISYGGKEVVCAVVRDITERIRAEQAIEEIREAERSRMARDLHDAVLQDLSYTAATMEVTKLKARGTDLGDELQQELDDIRRAVEGLRRAIYDLRSGDELNRPFPKIVESLVGRAREMAPACEIRLEVEEGFPSTSFGEAGTELLRVVQEALTNTRRHSGSRHAWVRLGTTEDGILLEVTDDGRGFDASTTGGGIGLRSMRERAAAIGGGVEVESEPGAGTTVRVEVPRSRLIAPE